MRIKFLTTLFLILIASSSYSQFFNIREQEPFGIKWRKIDTDHYEIIFPIEIEKEGQRVANMMEYLYHPLSGSLNNNHKKISILLSNSNVISNGYVSLGPRMSEWYLKPSKSYKMGAFDWINTLAIHEGRHIIQYNKLTNQGFTKLSGYFYGDLGKGLFSLFSAPNWFFEGDAVGMETVFSRGGRGRQPGFNMPLRTLILSEKTPEFYNSILGSYRKKIPSHYISGYFLNTYIRKKYGADILNKILNFSSHHSYNPFSFSAALKKYTGKNQKEIFKNTYKNLFFFWKNKIKNLNFNKYKVLKKNKERVWTNYFSPRFEKNGHIIAYKYGVDDIPKIVRISPDGEEKKLTSFSPINSEYHNLNYNSNKIVWSEHRPDIRWGKRGFAEIKIFDLKNNLKRSVTKKTRLFEPDISPDTKQIIAVEFTRELKSSLILIDSLSGNLLTRYNNPDNCFIKSPTWSENGKKVVYISQGIDGNALNILDTHTEEITNLIPYSFESIGYPKFFNGYVLYTSPYSGIDNIYAIDIKTKEKFQVTSAKFGAYNHDVSGNLNKLVYSNYTINGFEIVETELNRTLWKPLSEVKNNPPDYFKDLIFQEQPVSNLKLNHIPQKKHIVKKYKPIKHLLNVHSWGVIPYNSDLFLGFSSDNIIGTTSLFGGFKYNFNEKTTGFEMNGSYSALFPVFSFSANLMNRSIVSDKTIRYKWREKQIGFFVNIPLNFSRGIYRTRLNLGAGISYKKTTADEPQSEITFMNGNLFPIRFRLIYSNYKNTSSRYLNPSLGQNIQIDYKKTLNSNSLTGSLFSIKSSFYTPGIFKNNSFLFQAAYEKQTPGNYIFSNVILFSRGYEYTYNDSVFKITANYIFPLAYPDFAFGNYLYLKRISAHIFYDYCVGKTGTKISEYNSAGIELLTDISLLNIPYNFKIGSRVSYRFLDKKIRIDFLAFNFTIL